MQIVRITVSWCPDQFAKKLFMHDTLHYFSRCVMRGGPVESDVLVKGCGASKLYARYYIQFGFSVRTFG